jgi:hypothetical protein
MMIIVYDPENNDYYEVEIDDAMVIKKWKKIES